MSILLALLLGAGAVLLLLLVPLDLLFRAEHRGGFSSEMRIGWLFGLVGTTFPLGAGRVGPRPRKENAPPRKRERRRHLRGRMFAALLRTPGFPGRISGMAGDLLRSVRVRLLRVRAQVGFDDPAATGRACGLVASLSPLLQSPSLQVEWEPDFSREVFEGEAAGSLRVVPARILWVAGRFALHPVTLRALQAAFRERRA